MIRLFKRNKMMKHSFARIVQINNNNTKNKKENPKTMSEKETKQNTYRKILTMRHLHASTTTLLHNKTTLETI